VSETAPLHINTVGLCQAFVAGEGHIHKCGPNPAVRKIFWGWQRETKKNFPLFSHTPFEFSAITAEEKGIIIRFHNHIDKKPLKYSIM